MSWTDTTTCCDAVTGCMTERASMYFSRKLANWAKTPSLTSLLLNFSKFIYDTSSAIRQKGGSQNRCYKKAKKAKFSEKRTFLTVWYAHVRVRTGGKKCSFFGKFDAFCFLVTPVFRFALRVRNVCFSENLTCFSCFL